MRISDWSADVCSSDLAIHEKEETRQIQVLETYAQTERAMAGNIQSLADTMQKETVQTASMGTLPFCVPYAERFDRKSSVSGDGVSVRLDLGGPRPIQKKTIQHTRITLTKL